MKLNLQEYLSKNMLKAAYKLTNEEKENIPDNVDVDVLVKTRIVQSLLMKYYQEIGDNISETIQENGDTIYETELIVIDNLKFFKLLEMIASMPMRDAVNFATKLQSHINLLENKL